MNKFEIHTGDAFEILKTYPDNYFDCCVTSPPYFGLRDYGMKNQIGLEPSVEEYINKLILIFQQVKRSLKKEGTCWLNLGDSYNFSGGGHTKNKRGGNAGLNSNPDNELAKGHKPRYLNNYKPKCLLGIPWKTAISLQNDGWYLRSDIIWNKPNPMPESVKDRPTRSHEYIFLLTKSKRYYYNQEAIRMPLKISSIKRLTQPTFDLQTGGPKDGINPNRSCRIALDNLHKKIYSTRNPQPGIDISGNQSTRYGIPHYENIGTNIRSVWTIPTQPRKEKHFATFPDKLPEICIKAGCPEGGIVLDPFLGRGTSGVAAIKLNKNFIGIELNPEYAEMARKNILSISPLFVRG